MNKTPRTRDLVLVLGDQLNADSSAFDTFDPTTDAVWMAEVKEESTHVWSHKARTAVFLAAMRHFRDRLRSQGYRVEYRELTDPTNRGSLAAELKRAVKAVQPLRLIVVEPGDFRVLESLQEAAKSLGLPLDVRTDRHFFSTRADFDAHAAGRKQLRLEFFYRELRKRTGVLMADGEPVGGEWNFDIENRGSFGKGGPGEVPECLSFPPDAVTREVLAMIGEQFADHPGSLGHFDWPVTPADAELALADFIEHRLPLFGQYQDAMWTAQPYLYHSRLSASLNLKLIDPRRVVAAAEEAYRNGHAPLPAVEGFIRQILGWREYVRGVYWRFMPEYLTRNALNATAPLPGFFWTADTDLNCLRHALGQTLEYGYAHHIQRLMVTGLFCLLLGVEPRQVHEWYLAVYVDAVEWVEVPNVVGMSQFADGGVMASKPYVASGKYVQRMSNYCTGCRYDPAKSTGERACPFTTLYWDFLMRHEALLAANPRTVMQVRNLNRMKTDEKKAIRDAAGRVRLKMAE
ncbi:MAG: cryptochrome/photolyase family protein [Fimbriiglobus sp.]|jgi:deoxyribodipyrimidine photolyase-related protein|nr:cryptochrome/photolyase family protein [Fimbriiglobus sp.]